MAQNHTNKAAKARRELLKEQAMEYKLAGASTRFIAKQLGVSQTSVMRYVTETIEAARKSSTDKAAQLIDLESERIDRARFSIANAVYAGSVPAVREWRQLSESFRRLHGLDAPEKRAFMLLDGEAEGSIFDPVFLQEVLTSDQLEQLEEILTVLETAHAARQALSVAELQAEAEADALDDEDAGVLSGE